MNVKYGEQFLCFFVTTTVYNLYSLDSLREKKKCFRRWDYFKQQTVVNF